MPGDGITDVAPLQQNQEKGRNVSRSYRRRREEYVYVNGWIELLWEWWPGIADATNYPYRMRPSGQRDTRTPQIEERNEWFFAPLAADVATQWPGVLLHEYQLTVRRSSPGLPRQYRPAVFPIEGMIVPVVVSNTATWLPAIESHQAAYARRRSMQTIRNVDPFVGYNLALQMPETPLGSVLATTFGDVHYTGGSIRIG